MMRSEQGNEMVQTKPSIECVCPRWIRRLVHLSFQSLRASRVPARYCATAFYPVGGSGEEVAEFFIDSIVNGSLEGLGSLPAHASSKSVHFNKSPSKIARLVIAPLLSR